MSVSSFNSNTKMVDVIQTDYTLLPVINRFNIQLGFGDKTIEDICELNDISLFFFLDILNIYHDENYFPLNQLKEYPVDIIIDYLLKTHIYYKEHVLTEIEDLIKRLRQSCKEKCDNIGLIHKFYDKYKQELLLHIANEEERFFPYIVFVLGNYQSKRTVKTFRPKIKFSYEAHKDEHENVLGKLFDFKNIIIKYLPPDYDNNICNSLLYKLFMFDKDLNDHERLEDHILLPRLNYMEQQLKNKK